MQSLPLSAKIIMTQRRIKDWYEYWDGEVYVSFSGGKDSTVLLDIARGLYPDMEAVFVDTGLEYPEIKQFVKTKENVTWLRSKMRFDEVIKKYGYPVISKEVSRNIYEVRTTHSQKLRDIRLGINGYEKSIGRIPKKWQFLIDSDIPISNKCCDVMKKRPLKSVKKKAITGSMAEESKQRRTQWMMKGCNAFEGKHPISNPMSFWTEQDVLEYLKTTGIPYCSVYGDIVESTSKQASKQASKRLVCTGEPRTGCMFCCYGMHRESEPNKFQRMAKSHPIQYEFCVNGLGFGRVLELLGIPYLPIDNG